MGEAAGDRRSAERHGGDNMVLSSASWRRWMIVDGRGGAEVRCWECHQDHSPRECVSSSHGRVSWHVESALSP
jgi:hypothetical protein